MTLCVRRYSDPTTLLCFNPYDFFSRLSSNHSAFKNKKIQLKKKCMNAILYFI